MVTPLLHLASLLHDAIDGLIMYVWTFPSERLSGIGNQKLQLGSSKHLSGTRQQPLLDDLLP